MIIDSQENITVLTQEKVSLNTFLENFKKALPGVEKNHLILNLLSLTKVSANDLMEFLEFSRKHKQANKSFVLVANAVDFDKVHIELSVAPTLKEAYDVIEIEDIERDLDF
ncbi:ribonuclease Z [Galbibacter marinus]|uniref:Ribonuclease Z n=1 Tax=Galbibacter marinus TaxID=555500 RepID=K2PPA0_9FLAO|nr:hypothetical protein [Galbibacter marinus]EKF54320.1 ribonuclease Z [Galbibacter marinus]